MEVLNIEALIAQGKVALISQLDKNLAFLPVGVHQTGQRKKGGELNSYALYAISIAELLKQVSSNNTIFQEIVDAANNLGGESELYANTIPAGKLSANGDSIKVQYALKMPNNNNSKTIRVYFGGQAIFESINTFGDASMLAFFYANINLTLIRTGSTTARVIATLDTNDSVTPPSYPGWTTEIDLTTLDFTAINQIVLTGQGVANNDIVAKFAKGIFEPAAV